MTVLPGQMELPLANVEPLRYRRPGPRSRYAGVAAYLREHPGEWRCIDRRPSHQSADMLARNIRRGRPTVLCGMQVVVRRGTEVWACFPQPEQD